ALFMESTVFDLTIFAVSLGAIIAPCMLIKIFGWRHSTTSLIATLVVSSVTVLIFKVLGLSQNVLYDIPVGTGLGLVANFLVCRLITRQECDFQNAFDG
ncbi:MAG: hypothetical protein ACJ73D_11195, partial [Pyrinomonadaceae bacterium]